MIGISPARRSEGTQCRSVLSDAFACYIRALGRTDPPLAMDDLPDALSESRVLAAREGALVAGLLTFGDAGGVRNINSIAVAPGRQGQGIGTALIRAAEDSAIAQGLTALELCTAEVMEDRVRLYERLGFRTIRRALPPHGRDRFIRAFMRKDLAPG